MGHDEPEKDHVHGEVLGRGDRDGGERTVPIKEAAAQDSKLEQPDPASRAKRTAERPTPKLNKSPTHGLWALTKRDLRKWYTNPYQLIISLIQPVIWMGLFGKALNFSSFITAGAGAAGSPTPTRSC